jgi:hypothetical protein
MHAALVLPALLLAALALSPWIQPGHRLAELAFVVAAPSTPDPAAWVTPLVLLSACSAFWWSGFSLSRRDASGAAVGRRFDAGLLALAVVVAAGWAAGTLARSVALLVPAFFLFGVLALAMARGKGSGTRTFPQGFRGAGLVSSFVLAFGILVIAASMLLPLFRQAARSGYAALRSAASSLWPLLLAFLGWLSRLWTPRTGDYEDPLGIRQERLAGRTPMEGGPLSQILYWLLAGLIVAGALFLTARLAWKLLRFLGSRSERTERPAGSKRLSHLLRSYTAAVLGLLRRFLGKPVRHAPAAEAFARLSRWGGRSGVARLPSETPLEYSRRLGEIYPDLEDPAGTIADCLNQELYAGIAADAKQRLVIHRAAASLRRPSHWLARVRRRLRSQ